MKTGTVFDIKEFAVFDGPGIRTTVFMKGCPLRCMWCHNPEGLSAKPQLMVSVSACTHCGACQSVCEHPEQCTACGKCTRYCPNNLRKIAGTEWSSDKLAERLMRDKDVYDMSGGGITFSGGEPLLQWDFAREVFEQTVGVSKAIETSGFASDAIFASAMETCDLILMDWKVSDPELHLKYTGQPQEPILRHLQMLTDSDTPFILRMPIIPGVNDNAEHFERAAELVQNAANLLRVDVLPYQQAAGAKYEMVGKKYTVDFDETRPPRFFTEAFEKRGIVFRCFK